MSIDTEMFNILSLKRTTPSQNTKEYTHTLSGKIFSLQDFPLPILHKKKIKIINWKDLGEKMQIFIHLPNRDYKIDSFPLDSLSFEYAFDLFQGFDEDTGEQYSFLYKANTHKIQEITPLLESQNILLTNTGEFFIKKPITQQPEKLDNLSFLFGLFSIYGSFQKRGETILGAKIFIPLFGKYLQQKEFFVKIIDNLGKQDYFISFSLQETNDGEILQLSITDHELLQIFSIWYQSIEKNKEISKLIELDYAISLLKKTIDQEGIEFSDINFDHLKLLTKE